MKKYLEDMLRPRVGKWHEDADVSSPKIGYNKLVGSRGPWVAH
jgi:hypothetical protein